MAKKYFEIVDLEQTSEDPDGHSWVIDSDPRIREKGKISFLQKHPERFKVYPLMRESLIKYR